MTKQKKVRLPNFLIVGASRCGTTSLYHYLKEHPDIFMSSIKEPSFILSQFSEVPKNGIGDDRKKYIGNFDDYRKLFEKAGPKKAIGEASSENLYHYEKAIPTIQKFLGDPKIIIAIRNPVEKAYSAYTFLVSENREYLTFEEGLTQEEKRRQEGWGQIWFYKDAGFFSRRVKAYLESFSHVKICLFDDLKKNSLALAQDAYRFLGVDSSYVPDVRIRYKTSGIPRSKTVNKFFVEPTRLRSLARATGKLVFGEDGWIKWRDSLKDKLYAEQEMNPETRKTLENVFHDDIMELQRLIQIDLSHWLRSGSGDGLK
jgi:hypothetical protein